MSKQIIEINGVKLEVDLSTAKVIENYKVGDNVKVLIKQYADSFKSMPGVIVGFDRFEQRPTITIAYFDYSEIKLLYFNQDSKDVEICPMMEEEMIIEKDDVITKIDREIYRKEQELLDLKYKKNYFIKHFNKYFEQVGD